MRWPTDCHQLALPPQGEKDPPTRFGPWGRDCFARDTWKQPLRGREGEGRKSNSHLVVASDERLPGSYRGRAVHLHVGVVVFSHKHLQDVQHLCGENERRRRKRGGRRLGLSLKGLEQINITWTKIPTGRVSGCLWGIISLVLTQTAGASPPFPSLPSSLTHSLTHSLTLLSFYKHGGTHAETFTSDHN